MDPAPIPPSVSDLERRRLESTIDHDLHSLSISSLPTSTTSHSRSFISSSSSDITMEYPRAEPMSFSHQPHHYHYAGGDDTPRQSRLPSLSRTSFGAGAEQSMFVGASPVSTAGHHASAVTLGAGVFGRGGRDASANSEFDPERSLGRLVGELGRVMGSDRLPSRPTSPFSPPRSPSPLPSVQHTQPLNLSFTLTRNDPLLSPPSSGGENSHNQAQQPVLKPKAAKANTNTNSRFSSLARELGDDIRAARQPRRALSDSTSYNIQKTPVTRLAKEKNDSRARALRDESRRSASAPVRGTRDSSMDVTGFTALMATPAKGGEYDTLGKNGEVGGGSGGNIAQTLSTLHARLRALETENSVSRRRVRELEDELERARQEVELAKQDGGKRLRDVIGEKSALEDLVKSLRSHLARLTVEVEEHKAVITELRTQASSPRPSAKIAPGSPSVKSELTALRREIERLTKEVERLGGIVEEGLETRKKARGERTMRMEKEEMEKLVRQVIQEENDEEIARAKRDMERRKQASAQNPMGGQGQMDIVEPSKLRQGLHTAAANTPTLAPPTVRPNRVAPASAGALAASQRPTPPPSDDDGESCSSPTPVSRSVSRQGSRSLTPDLGQGQGPSRPKSKSTRREQDKSAVSEVGPSSPFPSILGDELEAEFFSPSRKPTSAPARAHSHQHAPTFQGPQGPTWPGSANPTTSRHTGERRSASGLRSARKSADGDELPPQTVLARVVAELEDDFVHYKAIYAELADQYKLLDPASVSAKRHVLADHLREVIDTLEQKADQIGDLYDLLAFSDRPAPPRAQGQGQGEQWVGKSVGDVLRMVKDSLGEDVWARLECDLGRNVRKSGGRQV